MSRVLWFGNTAVAKYQIKKDIVLSIQITLMSISKRAHRIPNMYTTTGYSGEAIRKYSS